MKSYWRQIVYFVIALACVICVLVAAEVGDELNFSTADIDGR